MVLVLLRQVFGHPFGPSSSRKTSADAPYRSTGSRSDCPLSDLLSPSAVERDLTGSLPVACSYVPRADPVLSLSDKDARHVKTPYRSNRAAASSSLLLVPSTHLTPPR